MQFLDRIGLARSDEQYRSTRRIFKLNQIVCIGQPSKISHLPSKLRFSAKCSFFGQSLSRGHYQPIYQPPEGVYLLNIPRDEVEGNI